MRFSFILHLLLSQEIKERGMSPELIPYGVSVGEVIETTLKQAQIVQYGSTMQITSQNNGGSCSGSNWIIPLTPQLILQN